jgi:hypothetical protein
MCFERIDREAAHYEHSTASATARGHESIFSLLARQARAKRAGLNRRRQQAARFSGQSG